VDKPAFVNILNDLRVLQTVAQDLYRGRNETGQKTAPAESPWFRTFDPVDMHAFVHRRTGSCGVDAASPFFNQAIRARSDPVFDGVGIAGQAGVRRNVCSLRQVYD
jgi:hypothetical protein